MVKAPYGRRHFGQTLRKRKDPAVAGPYDILLRLDQRL